MKILDIYHPDVRTIHQDATIGEVVQRLIKENFNDYFVVNDGETLVGIISVQDIAGAIVPGEFQENTSMASAMYVQGFFAERAKELRDVKVRQLMRTSYLTVSPHDNVMAITADFLKNDLYIVPVLDQGKLIGVITRSEIKKTLGSAMELSE